MKQQTAVEWLINEIDMQFPSINIKWKEWMIDRAKQMEKEQIIEAFYEGMKTNPFDPNRGRGTMYYNETYGKSI